MENKIFEYEWIKQNAEGVRQSIKAEYVNIHISTLGGIENTSIMIRISLDKKELWAYGIFENSRYYHFRIDRNGEVENFSRKYTLDKIRKKTVKTLQEAIEYINIKIDLQLKKDVIK